MSFQPEDMPVRRAEFLYVYGLGVIARLAHQAGANEQDLMRAQKEYQSAINDALNLSTNRFYDHLDAVYVGGSVATGDTVYESCHSQSRASRG